MQVKNWRTSNFSQDSPPTPEGPPPPRPLVHLAVRSNKRSTAENSFFHSPESQLQVVIFRCHWLFTLPSPKTFSPQATHYVWETQICRSAEGRAAMLLVLGNISSLKAGKKRKKKKSCGPSTAEISRIGLPTLAHSPENYDWTVAIMFSRLPSGPAPTKSPLLCLQRSWPFVLFLVAFKAKAQKGQFALISILIKKWMFPQKNWRRAAAETKTALNLELSDKKLMNLLNKHSFKFLGT